ncbi:ABC transporter substrate-binding protein [Neoaquamicrobium sediminum]|uniref:ABC transporter substrate-binding protein n=1 Tax=Neoaquamicrobium sediminum TaxID=1849104 RepID=UPI001566080B|nr:ABC transporter substrate-binding protein [Mesorhizobium sediminum]NRC57343.1 ABC transporter substrate-binding protein [Mesorhizobium sediminum]
MSINRRLFCGAMLAAPFVSRAHAQSGGKRKLIYAAGQPTPGVHDELWRYAVPNQMGYFAEEGLDVEIQFTAGSSAVVQLVVGGGANLGQANTAPIFGAIQKGASIRMYCNSSPRYASGLAVLADGPIKEAKDISGKLIGVSSLASGRFPEAVAMVKAAGLVPDKDVGFVAVGVGAQASTALSSNQVQGLYLWNSAYAIIQGQGLKLNIIRDVFPNYQNLLDGGLLVSNDLLEKKPETIAKYNRAIAKGMVFAAANPEAALDLCYKNWPDVAARSDKARAVDIAILKAIMPDYEYRNLPVPKFGYFPPEKVAFTTDFVTKAGQIAPGLDPETTYTNGPVDLANDFDIAAVEDAAKNFKP